MSRKSEQLRRQERMEILLTTLTDYYLTSEKLKGLFKKDVDHDGICVVPVCLFSARARAFPQVSQSHAAECARFVGIAQRHRDQIRGHRFRAPNKTVSR